MHRSFIQNTAGRARTFRQLWKNDQRGMAAIEFAMIAPIMLALFIGSVELSQAITVDRRVTQIASSMADLVAREKDISDAQLTNVMDIAKVLMRPYDSSLLRVSLIHVCSPVGTPANTKVCWSKSFQGGQTYAQGQAYTLPSAGLVDAGGAVMVAEVKYLYTPLIFSYYMPGLTTLQDKFYLKPRASSHIKYNGNDPCPTS